MTSDHDAFSMRLRTTWRTGDFGRIMQYYDAAAEQFMARRRLRPGITVLDLACGTGNLALIAARAGARATGIDLTPELLDQARARAHVAGLTAQFDEGDAEQLPYPDRSFDRVVHMFAAVFPAPERVAAEMTRVCKPGGEIALASYTSRGLVAEMGTITARYAPWPPNLARATEWAEEAVLRDRFRHEIRDLRLTPCTLRLEFPFSAPDAVEHYRIHYGPLHRAFLGLDAAGRASLRDDLETLFGTYNKAGGDSTVIDVEYIEATATRV